MYIKIEVVDFEVHWFKGARFWCSLDYLTFKFLIFLCRCGVAINWGVFWWWVVKATSNHDHRHATTLLLMFLFSMLLSRHFNNNYIMTCVINMVLWGFMTLPFFLLILNANFLKFFLLIFFFNSSPPIKLSLAAIIICAHFKNWLHINNSWMILRMT